MRQNVGPPSGCHIGSIFWRPTTMFPDHENPSNIAAAAATAASHAEARRPEETAPQDEPVSEQVRPSDGVPETPPHAAAPRAQAAAEAAERPEGETAPGG